MKSSSAGLIAPVIAARRLRLGDHCEVYSIEPPNTVLIDNVKLAVPDLFEAKR